VEVKIALYGSTQQVYLYPEKDGLRVTIHEITPKTLKITQHPKEEKLLDWSVVLKALNVEVPIDANLWAHVLKK
jgi:hypothetical protein